MDEIRYSCTVGKIKNSNFKCFKYVGWGNVYNEFQNVNRKFLIGGSICLVRIFLVEKSFVCLNKIKIKINCYKNKIFFKKYVFIKNYTDRKINNTKNF